MADPFGTGSQGFDKNDDGYLPNLMEDPVENENKSDTNLDNKKEGESEQKTKETIIGFQNYKSALQSIAQKDYQVAENYLKKSLKSIKESKQENTSVYLQVLRKLAFVNFATQRITQAERYYKICRDMSNEIEQVEDNGFEYHNSLLDFYLRTDLQKAHGIANEMLEKEFSTPNIKKIRFSLANLHLFDRKYDQAMESYQGILKMIPDDKLKAFTLHNMALTGVHQVNHGVKLGKAEPMNSDDHVAIISTFKSAIQILEKLPENQKRQKDKKVDPFIVDQILAQNTVIPEDFSQNSSEYLGHITSPLSAKIVSNMSEFLLLNEKHKPVNISFWFKVGLDTYENNCPGEMERFLVLLGLFYSATGEMKVAESMFQQAILKMKNETNYTKAMAYNMYGRMLLKHPMRKDQGVELIKQSEQIMQVLPHWYEKLESVFMM